MEIGVFGVVYVCRCVCVGGVIVGCVGVCGVCVGGVCVHKWMIHTVSVV